MTVFLLRFVQSDAVYLRFLTQTFKLMSMRIHIFCRCQKSLESAEIGNLFSITWSIYVYIDIYLHRTTFLLYICTGQPRIYELLLVCEVQKNAPCQTTDILAG